MLNWLEMRRDVFTIMLVCIDGLDLTEAVKEADNLISMLDGKP